MTTGHEVLPGAAVPAGPADTDPAPRPRPGQVGGNPEHQWRAEGAPSAKPARPGRLRGGRGTGGRWLVWILRGVLWAVVLLIGYRGVAAIVTGSPDGGLVAGGQASQRQAGFPVEIARAYALEFGQVYLSFSPATASARASALAQFLPPGADPQLGWDGIGTQSLQAEQVAGVRVLGAHSAVVTLLARVSGRLVEVAVPLYAAHGGLVVSGQPALLGAPPAAVPPASPKTTSDPVVQAALGRELPAFFRAFAQGGAAGIGTLTSHGTRIGGLGGAVSFAGLLRVSVPASGGATRHAVVTVIWRTGGQLPGRGAPSVAAAPAQMEMTYAMTVVRQGGTWYVKSIGAAATPEPAR